MQRPWSLRHLTIAQQLDPLSVLTNTVLGRSFYFARRYDLAHRHFVKAIDLDGQFWMAQAFRGLSYQQQRQYEEAIAEARLAEKPMLRVDPAFDSLRPDPRFGDLLRRLGVGS